MFKFLQTSCFVFKNLNITNIIMNSKFIIIIFNFTVIIIINTIIFKYYNNFYIEND